MLRRTDLPIMIGTNLHKGVVIAPDRHFGGGVNMFIVWLNKKIKSGETFTTEDIEKTNAIIHFCDKSSIEITIKTLQKALAEWREE